MLQLNLIGNLGADAEVKNLNGRTAVTFNVAHTERWKDDQDTKHESTTWVSCIFNGDGGNLLPYLKRGATVFISGPCSTRVYSSPKEHRMVAGLNLRVDHIELIGGKVDDVPGQLVTHEGLLIDTHKFYAIHPDDVAKLTPDAAGKRIIFDRQGHQYDIADAGWITPIAKENEATAPADDSAASADAPSVGETDKTNTKKKK